MKKSIKLVLKLSCVLFLVLFSFMAGIWYNSERWAKDEDRYKTDYVCEVIKRQFTSNDQCKCKFDANLPNMKDWFVNKEI